MESRNRFTIESISIQIKDALLENGQLTSNVNVLSLFAHEYTHLLCFYYTRFYLEYFSFHTWSLIETAGMFSKQNVIKLPAKETNDYTLVKSALKQINGSGKHIDNVSSVSFKENVEVDVKFKNYKVQKRLIPVIEFYDEKTQRNEKYNIGETAITECISYHVEKTILLREPESLPDLPYRAVDMLIEDILGVELKPSIIIALCYYSLHYREPGKYLVQTLRAIKNDGTLINSLNVFLDHLYSELINDTDEYLHYKLLELDLIKTKNFDLPGIYGTLFGYMMKHFTTGSANLKISKIPIIFEIFDISSNDDLKFSFQKFNYLINAKGPSPLVVDSDTLAGFGYVDIGPNDEKYIKKQAYSFLRGLLYFQKAIFNKEIGRCPFFDFCAHNSVKGYSCVQAPWDHVNQEEKCEIGFAGAFFNLANKQIEIIP